MSMYGKKTLQYCKVIKRQVKILKMDSKKEKQNKQKKEIQWKKTKNLKKDVNVFYLLMIMILYIENPKLN